MARWHPMFGPHLLIVMMVTAMVLAADTTTSQSEVGALQEESGAVTTGFTVEEKVPADAPAKTETDGKAATAATDSSHPSVTTTVASEMTTTKGDSTNINSSVVLMVLCGLGAFLRVSV